MLLLSCVEQPAREPTVASEEQPALGLGEVVSALRPHVDYEQSVVAAGTALAVVPAQAPFAIDVFLQDLAQVTALPVEAQWGAGGKSFAKLGTLTATLDAASRYVEITDSRAYAVEGVGTATEESLRATSMQLLAAMGIDADEAQITTIPLGAQSDGAAEPERMALKVFCMRTIGGLRVAGDRMVFSYANDGSLRAVRGIWPAVDVDATQWSVALSPEQVVDRALAALVNGGAATDSELPITIDTFYEHVTGASGAQTLQLRVAAVRQSGGPDDSGGRGARYEADLRD